MNTSEQILVIFLSTFLAIFLLLGIIVLAKMITVMNRLDRITEKVENITDKAEAIAETLGSTGLSAIVTKNFAMAFKKRSKR